MAILKSAYTFWMKLSFIIAWINTRLILIIIFYLIITPIGFAMRLFGVDLLDRKIDKNRLSYWKNKITHDLYYERRF